MVKQSDSVTLTGGRTISLRLLGEPGCIARFRDELDALRVVASGSKTTAEAVDYLLWRLLRVPTAKPTRDAFVSFLIGELGTDNIERARSYMEDALRMTVHLIMSTPEYQIV